VAPRRGSQRLRLVTLTSDVGSAYAAQMKAALIAGGVGASRIVDLAHDLPAHGVREAAFLLREMARAFPRTTVHVAVVDPGVGDVLDQIKASKVNILNMLEFTERQANAAITYYLEEILEDRKRAMRGK